MPYLPLRVSIPEPCHEDWNLMTTVDERHRHCAACDRTLTDFSAMSDPEIASHLRRHEGKLCGRFRKDQLERRIYPHPPRRYAGLRAIAASAAMLLSVPVAAQMGTTEPVEQRVGDSTVAPAHPSKQQQGQVRISGMVTDESGETLIGASVLVKGTATGAITDMDGRYSLLLPLGESVTLVYSYTGFETKSNVYSPSQLLDLSKRSEAMEMALNESFMGEVIITYGRPKPSLLESIMPHKIFTYKPEKPADYYYGKTGDWKDYWRELFAKRKARRAERKEERLLARAERRALMDDGQNPAVHMPDTAPAAAPEIVPDWQTAASPLVYIQVSPNPFEQQLNVSIELKENSELDFYLLDANGRLLNSWNPQILKGKHQLTLDLENDSLTPGAYFLRVVKGSQLMKTVTLVH